MRLCNFKLLAISHWSPRIPTQKLYNICICIPYYKTDAQPIVAEKHRCLAAVLTPYKIGMKY